MARALKFSLHESTISGAVSDAFSTIEALQDEMSEWASNMEGNNMEHLPKYDTVSEARDTLENANDEPDVPGKLPEGLEDKVQYSTIKKRRLSRSDRRDGATSALEATAEHIEKFLDDHDEQHACWQADGVDRDEWVSLQEKLVEVKDEIESVEFPGMYG